MNLRKISARPVFARYDEGSAELLRQALNTHAHVLEPVLVDKDYTGSPAEAFILYPGNLGCDEIVEHLRKTGDVLLFAGDEPWAALDATEGLSDRQGVHLVLDYAELREKALGLSLRKTLRETRILAVVPDENSQVIRRDEEAH